MTGEPRDVGAAETLAPAERWQRLALGVLQKSGVLGDQATPADAEARLRTRLLDGFDVAALCTDSGRAPEPGFPGARPFLRGGRPAAAVTTGWDVRALHDDPEPQVANAAILDDLNGGVTSIWLRLAPDAIPPASLPTVLDGVLLDLAPVALDAGPEGPEVARAFLRLLHERGVAPDAARGTLGIDPLGLLVRTGAPADLAGTARLAVQVARTHPALRTITIDALAYVEVGASDTEELGCSIASGIAYLRSLMEGGLDVDTACRQLEFRYAATQDQWMTIAKLRAARRLWSRVTEVLGASEDVSAQRQHAVAAPTMLTRRNPWVNLLRVAVAVFAAGVAGADAITAVPFDAAIGRSDDLARRLARNTLALLQDEAELSAVVDPAGGSWYVEQLTDELARAAWPWVQEIERLRGRPDALASGLVAARIAKTRTQRIDRLRRRLDPITGVSEFADLEERPVVRVPRRPAPEPDARRPLRVLRAAAMYEALRDRADAAPTRPTAFLATLGPISAHAARATFTANLLAAGGIASESAGPTSTPDEVVAAFRRAPRAVACLCGTDDAYASLVEPLAAALHEAGARAVCVAGRPRNDEQEREWRSAGVDRLLFDGCDAVEALEDLLTRSGVG